MHISLAPPDYDTTLGPLPEGVILVRQLRGQFDFIQFFIDRRANLERCFPALKKAQKKDGMLCVSWPKKASGGVHGRARRRSARHRPGKWSWWA